MCYEKLRKKKRKLQRAFKSVWILCSRYLKNGISNHLQIFTVSLPWWGMDRIIRSSWYAAILVMQMKVKGQISINFLSQQPFVPLSPIFVCIWSVTRQSYCIIRSSWYAAILVMQMKVKGQISFSFVSQEPLVRLSSNFVCILNVIRQSFHKITPTY